LIVYQDGVLVRSELHRPLGNGEARGALPLPDGVEVGDFLTGLVEISILSFTEAEVAE